MNQSARHATTPSPAGLSNAERQATRPRFNPWPVSILATFIVFICGTVGLVVLATQHRNDLVADDYYEQEIRYQARMNQLRRTEPFRDEIVAVHDSARRQLELSFPAHLAGDATGTVQLYRPNQSTADRSFAFAATPEGRQTLPATDLAPGLWKVRLHWTYGGEEYYAERPIVVTSEKGP